MLLLWVFGHTMKLDLISNYFTFFLELVVYYYWYLFNISYIGATIAPFVVGVILSVYPDDSFKSLLLSYWTLGGLIFVTAIPVMLLRSPPLEKKEEEGEHKTTIRSKGIFLIFLENSYANR